MAAKKWSDRVTYQGRRVNRGTKAVLDAANVMLSQKKFGGESSPITLIQGSYNGGVVAQSAGTHDGGGAFDLTAHNAANRLWVLRLLGAPTWDRKTIPRVWNRHLHGLVQGDGTTSEGAKRQLRAYKNGKNGMAGNGPDDGPRLSVVPYFVAPWKKAGATGVFYLKQRHKAYKEPSKKAKVLRTLPKGKRFTVVARVRVAGKYWAINFNGLCVPASVLTSRRPVVKK